MSRIIARIKGGLGNQLFCYAAARRMALANDAELVLDEVTGFTRDSYQRSFVLDHFNILARKASPIERMEPFGRLRRRMLKWLSRRKPFGERAYVEQEGLDFDERILRLEVRGSIYLDGYWQSEAYFNDMEEILREDLRIIPPADAANRQMAEHIHKLESVMVHVRWFERTHSSDPCNPQTDYYRRAIALMDEKLAAPHYFLFSDDVKAARGMLPLPENRMTIVHHNQRDENAYADLWLMTQCRHFIIANSTFSWWGAWLCQKDDKTIIAPDRKISSETAWGFRGLIPSSWIVL